MYKCIFLFNLYLILWVQRAGGFWLWGNEDKNKVDGKWSEWSKYSSCQLPSDASDRFPYRFRTRECNNPAPKAGGKPCKGQARRKGPCSDCDTALGIESKIIQDSKISASSFHEEFPPKYARLNGPSAWCAKDLTGELYLQVDFESLTLITAVATQGYYPDPKQLSLRLGSVSKYQITFSDDGITFEVYENTLKNKVFTGNGNNLETVLNIFDPQIAAKHIRIHPTAYIKFVCMKFEVYGCRFKCGGYLPSTPGDLLAVSSEVEDIDCFWQAQLLNSSKINLDFINFNLPCKYGQVEVRGSHQFYGGSKRLGRYCDNKLAPPPVTSNRNKLWIRFQSMSPDPLVGFYGIYFPNCDTILNSTQGTFHTPKYPELYNHNSKCSWSITVPKGNAIMLEFLDFDIEKEVNCNNDYLTIYDSNSTTIGQYCNSKRPPTLVCSSSNTMRLNFKSDDVLALKGFLVTYQAIKAGAPCAKPSSSIISPTPTIQFSTVPSMNATVLPTFAIVPTTTVLSPSVSINSSLGVMTGSGVQRPGRGNRPKKKDDDEDTGLTTIIIISVFSFIVLCMIIISVVPSLIHGYEKRKREREWIAAADVAVKKNVVQNEYEMQPIKPQDDKKIKDQEPNEETAFLDPENPSLDEQDGVLPCLTVIKKEDTTSPPLIENDKPLGEDLGCELEYDTTDLNLSASYEDLGSSFATEMAALLNNYDTISPPNKRSSSPLPKSIPQPEHTDQLQSCPDEADPALLAGQGQDKDCMIDRNNSDQVDKLPESEEQCINNNDMESPEIAPQNEQLQEALTDLKDTLTNIDSDSGSSADIAQLETCSSWNHTCL